LRGAAGKFANPIRVLVLIVSQVFLNPINETVANRDGIVQVVRKMKWYSSLSKLLLQETSEHDKQFADLRSLLAIQILDLYKALLKYIIKSICVYNQHPAVGVLRNLVKLDDWNGSLDELNKAEGMSKQLPVTMV
jgi:hypothetical protein